MASDDPTRDVPSIAPPSLGFGLRRRTKHEEPPPEPPAGASADPVQEASRRSRTIFDVAPVGTVPTTPEPHPTTPQPDPTPPPTPSPEPLPAPEPSPEPTPGPTPLPSPEPVPLPAPEPSPIPDPGSRPDVTRPAPVTASVPAAAATLTMPSFEPVTTPAPHLPARSAQTAQTSKADQADQAAKPARSSRLPRLPGRSDREPAPARVPRDVVAPVWLVGRVAAVVTGLVVGLVLVLATALALRLCELVRGTSSCGSAGFFLLVAILLLGVLVGSAVLRVARVPDPGSTSVLAVGLTSVIALLFLVDQLFAWWMVIVIPLVSAGTFALSHWVTTTFSDDAKS
ncbi:MAG: hypothetical protein LH468_11565 [Nocardioides sp.]|nr:hypothetical protein [Nocardioides sp.]